MTNTPGILSLLHALDTCPGHGRALREALDDLDLKHLGACLTSLPTATARHRIG